MTSLLLDTSTERGILSIARAGVPILCQEIMLGLTASESIVRAIDVLCTKAAIDVHELLYIAVGIGPGSYTGIRIGVACAKAISFACKRPLVGISGLHGFIPEKGFSEPFLSVIDARVGGMYVLELSNPVLIPFDQFIQKLKGVSALITPSRQTLIRRLEAGNVFTYPPIFERAPCAASLHKIAEEKYKNEEYSLDGTLDLLYLRPTQAEIEKNQGLAQ